MAAQEQFGSGKVEALIEYAKTLPDRPRKEIIEDARKFEELKEAVKKNEAILAGPEPELDIAAKEAELNRLVEFERRLVPRSEVANEKNKFLKDYFDKNEGKTFLRNIPLLGRWLSPYPKKIEEAFRQKYVQESPDPEQAMVMWNERNQARLVEALERTQRDIARLRKEILDLYEKQTTREAAKATYDALKEKLDELQAKIALRLEGAGGGTTMLPKPIAKKAPKPATPVFTPADLVLPPERPIAPVAPRAPVTFGEAAPRAEVPTGTLEGKYWEAGRDFIENAITEAAGRTPAELELRIHAAMAEGQVAPRAQQYADVAAQMGYATRIEIIKDVDDGGKPTAIRIVILGKIKSPAASFDDYINSWPAEGREATRLGMERAFEEAVDNGANIFIRPGFEVQIITEGDRRVTAGFRALAAEKGDYILGEPRFFGENAYTEAVEIPFLAKDGSVISNPTTQGEEVFVTPRDVTPRDVEFAEPEGLDERTETFDEYIESLPPVIRENLRANMKSSLEKAITGNGEIATDWVNVEPETPFVLAEWQKRKIAAYRALGAEQGVRFGRATIEGHPGGPGRAIVLRIVTPLKTTMPAAPDMPRAAPEIKVPPAKPEKFTFEVGKPNFTMEMTHALSQDEALARVKGLLGKVKTEHADKISDLREEWVGNVGRFSFKAKGFEVSGSLTVSGKKVELGGKLPFAAKFFKGTIEKIIREQGEAQLRP